MNHARYVLAICYLLVALSTTGLAFDGDDFISASYDPRHPEQPAIVLRVPRVEQVASVWNPETQKLPFSPDEAVKMVLGLESVRSSPKDWKVVRVSFSAMDQMLFSNLNFIAGASPGLITHYTVELSHLPDGTTHSFMVLMNGKIFSPRPEKHSVTK